MSPRVYRGLAGLTYPFPVSFLEVDIDDWAAVMMRQLITLMNHQPAGPTVHHVRGDR